MIYNYNYEYFKNADGIASWNGKSLKFGDTTAALCYAHGITWEDLKLGFPDVFSTDHDGRSERYPGKLEQQLEFIKTNAKRNPGRILEIGGGRGEVAQVAKYFGHDIVSLEPSTDADKWYKETATHFFGNEFDAVMPDARPLLEATPDLDLSSFDTILMVESLEHIPQEQFEPFWQKVVETFQGRFIVVNWVSYHPIAVGQYAGPEQHCRLVNDELYDTWSAQAKSCFWRNGSHLVLDF